MKKIIFLICLMFVLGSFSVFGVDGGVGGGAAAVVAFSVNPLNYGVITPPGTSDFDSIITVNEANNVDLSIDISILVPGPNNIFQNIIFDIIDVTHFPGDGDFTDDAKIGVTHETLYVDDIIGVGSTVHTRLDLPTGFPATAPTTGTITYVGMARVL